MRIYMASSLIRLGRYVIGLALQLLMVPSIFRRVGRSCSPFEVQHILYY